MQVNQLISSSMENQQLFDIQVIILIIFMEKCLLEKAFAGCSLTNVSLRVILYMVVNGISLDTASFIRQKSITSTH